MSKTKVKQDRHGPYIRGAGYIWRPDFPIGYQHVHLNQTQFAVGSEVSVSHSGGPLASIRQGDTREYWYAHGSYYKMENGKLIPGYKKSEECFRPDYENW